MDEVLTIFQYQSVLFSSTTTGAIPITLNWSFPGGLPLSATGTSNVVFYNAPGEYTASLTASDSFGTTDVLIKPNIIRVDPTTVTPGISGPTPSVVTMSQNYSVDDASVGNPFPAISWYWQLPYGVTASTQNVNPVTGYPDWNTLTGTYSGAPGSSYFGEIKLTVNNGFTPATAITSIEVLKMGPVEQIGLNSIDPTSSAGYSTGTIGEILTNPPLTGLVPDDLSSFGYSGTGSTAYVFHVDTKLKSTGANPNVFFHSTNESASVLITTGFYTEQYLSLPQGDVLGGFLIVNPPVYGSPYSTTTVSPGILNGEYLIPSETTDFYLGDFNGVSTGLLSEVYNDRNYTVPLINYLLSNPYKLIFSGNIQRVNELNSPGMTFINLGYHSPLGNGNNNPAVYSPETLDTIISSTGNIYEVTIDIVGISGPIPPIIVPIGVSGATGNDPLTSGAFFTAQDTINGSGFVTILNTALLGAGVSGVVFEAQEFFNCDYSGTPGTFNSPSDYYGVALKITDRTDIQNVIISDNSTALNVLATGYLGPAIAPFTADILNPSGATATCTGMFNIPSPQGLEILPGVNNVLTMGGSIGY
jgi:hypothetical protein